MQFVTLAASANRITAVTCTCNLHELLNISIINTSCLKSVRTQYFTFIHSILTFLDDYFIDYQYFVFRRNGTHCISPYAIVVCVCVCLCVCVCVCLCVCVYAAFVDARKTVSDRDVIIFNYAERHRT